MEISLIGWIHTVLGTLAILVALISIVTQGYIKSTNNLGKFYIIATLITAGTALMLFKNGGFNLAHLLAVLTIVAIILGLTSEKYNIFGPVHPWNFDNDNTREDLRRAMAENPI